MDNYRDTGNNYRDTGNNYSDTGNNGHKIQEEDK